MKSTVILTLSIIAGLIAVLLVRTSLSNAKGTPYVAFVATADIPAGQVVGANCEAREYPSEMFPAIGKEAPGKDLESFVRTTPVKRPIARGEIVSYRHLETTVDPGIQPTIPEGMKAISIGVSATTAVAYFIQPGDVVDVIGTFPDMSTQGAFAAKPVLQAVTVLAVGSRYRRADAVRPAMEPYPTVTLLVTMAEAAKLTLAQQGGSQGGLTLLLRNPSDTARTTAIAPLGVMSAEFDRIGNQAETPP